jgi:hypothetical protein
MNTRTSFTYRDAANNKQSDDLVVEGTPDVALLVRLAATLDDYEHFGPLDVGITPVCLDPFPEHLGMLEPLDEPERVRLEPGERRELHVATRFANCEYYTERAVNLVDHAVVTVERLGVERTVHVPYPRQIVLRSPTILGCPDRVTDRSARQRMLARDD